MNMKLVALLFIFLASIANANDFTGSWNIVYPINGVEKINKTFDLHLQQTGNNICGLHFGSARKNRVRSCNHAFLFFKLLDEIKGVASLVFFKNKLPFTLTVALTFWF